MASALVREQATLALDDIDLRTRAWEDRVRQVQKRAAAGVGALGRALTSGQPAWVRPLVVAGGVAWLVSRLRGRRVPASADAPREGGQPPRAGSSWAAGSLLLINLPRLIRWSRRARLALKVARLWQQQGQGRGRDQTRDSAKSRRPRS